MKKLITIATILTIALILSLSLLLPACAEERTCWISRFILEDGAFEVIDENGFIWVFSLEEEDYFLFQEWTLILPEDADPYLAF